MEIYDNVFNKSTIHGSLFFNIKGVLEYPTLEELEKNKPELHENWKLLSESKYSPKIGSPQTIYEDKAVFSPEYLKIVAISYATVSMKDGELERHFKKIVNKDENLIIATFMDVLNQLSDEDVTKLPYLCGHNIVNYDIPLLIKKFIYSREKLGDNKTLPSILKYYLGSKPWESKVIDTINVWKFNGLNNTPLSLMSDFLGLKKGMKLMSYVDLSKYYWSNVIIDNNDTLNNIAHQSATQTNLIIQFMNEMRNL